MEEQANSNQAPAQVPMKESKQKTSKLPMILVVFLILSLAGNGYTYWQYKDKNEQSNKFQKQTQDLQTQIDSLKSKYESEQSSEQQSDNTQSDDSSASDQTFTITGALKENIKAVFDTMNTQPMESYMAPTVRVIIAASEGIGDRTPAQAVSDLNYFSSATAPWDFDLPAATLSSYGSDMYYGSYFGENTLVGKAASSQIVSMHFNADGKIDVIFMMASEDLFS